MRKTPKLTAAQRLARIQEINAKLQEENDMLRTNYGVDAHMGIDQDSLDQTAAWKAQDVGDEAMNYIPELGRKVGEALQPAMEIESPEAAAARTVGDEYSQRMSRELEPRVRRAFNPIFPRRSL